MKKYWKLSTIILASSMLISGCGAYSLANRNTNAMNNQALLNEFNNNQQTNNVQVVNSVNDIQFISDHQNISMFALVKDAENGDRIYRWGTNEFGQLGGGYGDAYMHFKVPTPLENFWGKRPVTHILSTGGFSVIVIDNRELWCTGSNMSGQFGVDTSITSGSYEFVKTYTFDEPISNITGGSSHAAAIVNGKLYTWGLNNNGQLGHGNNDNVSTPKEVLSGIDGTPKEVKCSDNDTAVLAENLGVTSLYLFGENMGKFFDLGDVNVLSPKAISLPFSSGIEQFHLGGSFTDTRTFFILTKDDQLYGFGTNKNGALGIGSTNVPTLISIPDRDKIKKVDATYNSTLILTESGSIWTTGRVSGQGDISSFQQLSSLSNVTDTYFCADGHSAIKDGSIYAWGYNSVYTFGNGMWNNDAVESPILIDPFSTPSSIVQTAYNNAETAQDVAKKIYSDAGVFNGDVFSTYVKKEGFFEDTTYTMTSAPVVDAIKGEIKCTVQASKSYTQPDGAKSITDKPFEVTLTGFKVLADSKIVNLPLAVDTKYNLNNIEKAMKLNGTSDVNESTFGDLFTTSDFHADNKFSIDTSTIENGIYKATLIASKAQVNGYVVDNKTYNITIEGLKPQPDSTVTVNTNAKNHFNGNNIKKAINSDGKGKVNVDNLKLICDIGNFPADNVFTISNDTSVGGTYNATLSATKYYSGGDIIDTGTTFTILITDLTEVPDSAISSKTDANKHFNANNIVNAINPKKDGVVIRRNLDLICDYVNFPLDTIFTIKNDKVTGDTYNAILVANKYYEDGYLVDNVTKDFSISVTGLELRPDSTVTVKIDVKDRFNANNIVKAINPDGNGTVNFSILESICNIGNFPTENIFTISNDKVTATTYNAILSASKYYLDGNITNGPKTFAIQITGLTEVPDTNIIVKADANNHFNANNIIKSINPDGNGTVKMNNLLLICDVVNIPSGDTPTIKNDKVVGTTYTATLNVNNYYAGGNLMTTSKDFTIQVTNLQLRPDSNVFERTPTPDKFDDITTKLKEGEVIDRDTLSKLIDTSYFPIDTVFTIDSVEPDKDNSTVKFTFTPDKVYKDGNAIANTDGSKVGFDANVKFEFPVEPAIDNTGLTVGLSICGAALLLIIIGLLVWYLKRRNKDSDDNEWVLY